MENSPLHIEVSIMRLSLYGCRGNTVNQREDIGMPDGEMK
jgi:hypothetical protein